MLYLPYVLVVLGLLKISFYILGSLVLMWSQPEQVKIPVLLKPLCEKEGSNASFYDLGCAHFTMSDKTLQNTTNNGSNLLSDEKYLAYSYHNLGVKKLDMGDFGGAVEALEKALQLTKEHLAVHPDTANSFNVLGYAYLRMGNNRSAIETLNKAAEMRSILPGDHKDTACTYNLLGIAQLYIKELDQALESLQKASRLNKKLLGDDPATAVSLHYLGHVYSEMGDNKSAAEEFQNAAEMRSRVLGDHEDTASSYHWLGTMQVLNEDLNGAGLSNAGLATKKRIIGRSHRHC